MSVLNTKILLGLALVLSMASCTVYTSVETPRPMDLANLNDIDSVAILNRTGIINKKNAGRIIETVITGEAIGADERGAAVCTQGLYDYLSQSLNYRRVVRIDQLYLNANEYRFSDPLNWDTVAQLCKENNVEALFVLEYFDSNSGIAILADGGNIPVLPYPATNPNAYRGKTTVKLGYRIYVPRTREIRDQWDYKAGFQRPVSPIGSGGNFNSKTQGISAEGYNAGIDYSYRTSDQIVLENRVMYKGGNPRMRQASRMAFVGQWDQAAEIWMAESGSHKRKIRQRALHNLSIYAEKQGNLQLALEHAQHAFGTKGKSLSAAQVANINRRMQYEEIFATRAYRK